MDGAIQALWRGMLPLRDLAPTVGVLVERKKSTSHKTESQPPPISAEEMPTEENPNTQMDAQMKAVKQQLEAIESVLEHKTQASKVALSHAMVSSIIRFRATPSTVAESLSEETTTAESSVSDEWWTEHCRARDLHEPTLDFVKEPLRADKDDTASQTSEHYCTGKLNYPQCAYLTTSQNIEFLGTRAQAEHVNWCEGHWTCDVPANLSLPVSCQVVAPRAGSQVGATHPDIHAASVVLAIWAICLLNVFVPPMYDYIGGKVAAFKTRNGYAVEKIKCAVQTCQDFTLSDTFAPRTSLGQPGLPVAKTLGKLFSVSLVGYMLWSLPEMVRNAQPVESPVESLRWFYYVLLLPGIAASAHMAWIGMKRLEKERNDSQTTEEISLSKAIEDEDKSTNSAQPALATKTSSKTQARTWRYFLENIVVIEIFGTMGILMILGIRHTATMELIKTIIMKDVMHHLLFLIPGCFLMMPIELTARVALPIYIFLKIASHEPGSGSTDNNEPAQTNASAMPASDPGQAETPKRTASQKSSIVATTILMIAMIITSFVPGLTSLWKFVHFLAHPSSLHIMSYVFVAGLRPYLGVIFAVVLLVSMTLYVSLFLDNIDSPKSAESTATAVTPAQTEAAPVFTDTPAMVHSRFSIDDTLKIWELEYRVKQLTNMLDSHETEVEQLFRNYPHIERELEAEMEAEWKGKGGYTKELKGEEDMSSQEETEWEMDMDGADVLA